MKVKVTSLAVLLLSVFLFSALLGVQVVSVASAEGPYDWPMFRHDLTNSGYSDSPAPSTNQTLWNSTTIAYGGQSTPVVADGKLYVGSWGNALYCFDAANGTRLWLKYLSNYIAGSCAVADGRLYSSTLDCNIYCHNATNGDVLWNFKTSNITGSLLGSSPAVADGKVYVGSFDKNVYCLDALDGTIIWNYTTGDYVPSSPALADGKLYVGSRDSNVYCLDAATGTKIWNYTTGDDVVSSPIVANGKLWVGSVDTNVYCLDADTGTQIWNYTAGGEVFPSPIVADGKVYVASWDGNVYCLDATTGDFIWSFKVEESASLEDIYGSPVVANGVVYVYCSEGPIYAFGVEPPLSGAAWSKTYGGTGEDLGQGETVQTSDGGYTISGDTNSSGAGGMDFWLIKTDADGNMLWNQTYGGPLDESALDMCQTSDGGYAISGSTYSFGAGGQDVWLVKTDADGNMLWNQTYGGTGDDFGHPVIQTSDGGYLISGTTDSFGAGGQDAWLIKTDADGNMLWNQTYGGPSVDQGYSVVQTGDGGYTVVVITDSFGAGSSDTWLIKTDADGNMLWNQTYGGTGIDIGFSLIQSSDGGYAMAGFTTSFGGYKIYFVKADANGTMQWNQTYQISAADIGIHGIQTADGGYAIVGWIYQNGQDFALYKTNATGDLEWTRSYGGTGLENGYALLQDSDGGYVLTGNTNSSGAGGTDIWLVKVDGAGVIPESFTVVVITLLSTVSVLVSFWLLRKRPKLNNSLLEKP